MAKWVRWIAYFFWGLLCFLFCIHLFFPYEALGRRILHALEQRTTLSTRSSEPEARLLGIQWARVEVSGTRQKDFPPLEIRRWVIQLRPLSLLIGRLSATSRGTLMGGTFRMDIVMGRKRHRGRAEWSEIKINRFPVLSMEQTLLGGVVSGRASWDRIGEGIAGKASFEIRDGRIENAQLAGLRLPLLDLGRTEGQVTWKEERIDLIEISTAGKDLKAKLTGNVFFQIPIVKSRLKGRLEIDLTENLMRRYPAMEALAGGGQGGSRPLVMTIHGTLEAPKFSIAR